MWCMKCRVMRRGALPSIIEPPLFLSPDNQKGDELWIVTNRRRSRVETDIGSCRVLDKLPSDTVYCLKDIVEHKANSLTRMLESVLYSSTIRGAGCDDKN